LENRWQSGNLALQWTHKDMGNTSERRRRGSGSMVSTRAASSRNPQHLGRNKIGKGERRRRTRTGKKGKRTIRGRSSCKKSARNGGQTRRQAKGGRAVVPRRMWVKPLENQQNRYHGVKPHVKWQKKPLTGKRG